MACKACRHPLRDRVDRDLLAAVPIRQVVSYTGLSVGGVCRHKQHVREMVGLALKDRAPGEALEHGGELLKRVEKLVRECESIIETAKSKSDLKATTNAISVCGRLLELCMRATGGLASGGGMSVSFTNHTVVNNFDGSDLDLALAISEGTRGFDEIEIQRLKALVENRSDNALTCNSPATSR